MKRPRAERGAESAEWRDARRPDASRHRSASAPLPLAWPLGSRVTSALTRRGRTPASATRCRSALRSRLTQSRSHTIGSRVTRGSRVSLSLVVSLCTLATGAEQYLNRTSRRARGLRRPRHRAPPTTAGGHLRIRRPPPRSRVAPLNLPAPHTHERSCSAPRARGDGALRRFCCGATRAGRSGSAC